MNDVLNGEGEVAAEMRDRLLHEVTERGKLGTALGIATLVWECAVSVWFATVFYRGDLVSRSAPTFIEVLGDHAARLLG